MKSKRVVASVDELLNPANSMWDQAEKVELAMETPPIGNVPSNYFRAMDPTKIGAVKSIQVSSLHNGESLFFKIEWDDPVMNDRIVAPGVYRDGAGVLFPFKETARINNMGSKNEPVNAWCWQAGRDDPFNVTAAGLNVWCWQAGRDDPFNVTAAGLGTTRREDRSYGKANPVYKAGGWTVVICRPFKTPEPDLNVALKPGITKQVGFAVWEGGAGERAGAKSFCGNWNEVEIEP